MALYQLGDLAPQLDPSSYVTDSARIVGDVALGPNASVWFGAVIRADNDMVRIGEGSNVQDNAVLHADPGFPLHVGRFASIGHMAMVHGCTIGDGALIGIGAVVLNGAKIGRNCLVGAGALVTEGKEFPDNSLILGSPAKLARTLSEEQIAGLRKIADSYIARAGHFKQQLKRIS